MCPELVHGVGGWRDGDALLVFCIGSLGGCICVFLYGVFLDFWGGVLVFLGLYIVFLGHCLCKIRSRLIAP